MCTRHASDHKTSEEGAALLIALFALLLISAVGVAMIVAGGTEGSLASNFRASTNVFYAAMSGMEEGRGRMSGRSPNYLGPTIPRPVPAGASPTVYYITNPVGGETVAPFNTSSTTTYPDAEYAKEFKPPAVTSPAFQPYINSVWTGANTPGPIYKWVRINAVTEQALGISVSGGSPLDGTTPLYYDGGHLNLTNQGSQALQVTALAALPDGSRRLLQYIIGPLAAMPIDAAIHAKGSANAGSSLNVSGFTDPVCSSPNTYAIITASPQGTSGSGNLTGGPPVPPGSPPGTPLPPQGAVQGPFPYNLNALINAYYPDSAPINSLGTGVTANGNPPTSYSGSHPVLGTPPSQVTYDPSSGAIIAISPDGVPAIYLAGSADPSASPVNVTLGTSVIDGGLPVRGMGALIVRGNLTIDITNGFNYFGLILVTGDVTITANPAMQAAANIHGTIILGGDFHAEALSNLSGSIFIHQNACLVQSQIDNLPQAILSFRELPQ